MAQVLIVDDHAGARETVAHLLALRGHQSTGAIDGREALSKLLTDRPDVVVLDMRMPRLDGLGLLELLRAYRRWTKLPVILLTGEARPDEIRRARDLGVNHVFHKTTFKPDEFADAVDQCITPKPTTPAH
jgi:two-component system KDP operon response regulator KdpE